MAVRMFHNSPDGAVLWRTVTVAPSIHSPFSQDNRACGTHLGTRMSPLPAGWRRAPGHGDAGRGRCWKAVPSNEGAPPTSFSTLPGLAVRQMRGSHLRDGGESRLKWSPSVSERGEPAKQSGHPQ